MFDILGLWWQCGWCQEYEWSTDSHQSQPQTIPNFCFLATFPNNRKILKWHKQLPFCVVLFHVKRKCSALVLVLNNILKQYIMGSLMTMCLVPGIQMVHRFPSSSITSIQMFRNILRFHVFFGCVLYFTRCERWGTCSLLVASLGHLGDKWLEINVRLLYLRIWNITIAKSTSDQAGGNVHLLKRQTTWLRQLLHCRLGNSTLLICETATTVWSSGTVKK